MPNREELLEALSEIGRRLEAEGKSGQVILAGGASMCLVHSARETTEDVDALFEPQAAFMFHAIEVGMKYGWPPGWLNEEIRAFMDESAPKDLFITLPGLQVFSVVPEYLLAMKIKASRAGTSDLDDAEFLMRKLGLSTEDEVKQRLSAFLDFDMLGPGPRFAFREMAKRLAGSSV